MDPVNLCIIFWGCSTQETLLALGFPSSETKVNVAVPDKILRKNLKQKQEMEVKVKRNK